MTCKTTGTAVWDVYSCDALFCLLFFLECTWTTVDAFHRWFDSYVVRRGQTVRRVAIELPSIGNGDRQHPQLLLRKRRGRETKQGRRVATLLPASEGSVVGVEYVMEVWGKLFGLLSCSSFFIGCFFNVGIVLEGSIRVQSFLFPVASMHV